ncbi:MULTISPECIES: UDP-glucose dehydrogenase family protein [Cohnella]|uniref:UDP-glucose dehydrogenase family protein n=1 Tax=Cohnella TaxID=329857 RepID=UPI0009BBAD15|nr:MULTISPECIES: UDP-glucose/GDP-mannose dehydrogenase family protein [Cohnella]MBN2980562.1 UDP-glucose/GDP-mannose dehydrogenase family protein [Cohnella algarum]
MHMAVIGAGIAGLTTAAGFAELGHRVDCYDADSGKIRLLTQGTMPYVEPELEALVARNAEAGRLKFGSNPAQMMHEAETVFLAVGTPSADDGQLQLSFLWAAAERIGEWADGKERTVVVKSTVPVGTADRLESRLRSRLPAGCPVHVASLPDFMREGHAVADFFQPSRIVIGAANPETAAKLERLHRPFCAPVVHMDRRSAELSKLAANGALAVKLSFANEMASLAEHTGADYPAIARALGLDPRIGPQFLGAGLGFGGSSLPKDARGLVRLADEAGAPQTVVSAAIRANALLPLRMVRKLEAAISGPSRRKVALLGLAFKPGTADMREAPSLRLATELLRRHPGIRLSAYDPAAGQSAKRMLPNAVRICGSAEEALHEADAAIVVTDWPEFRHISANDFKKWMKRAIILDGRNHLDAVGLNAEGVVCIGIGRLPEATAELDAAAADFPSSLLS